MTHDAYADSGIDAELKEVSRRLNSGDRRMKAIEEKIDANTLVIEEVRDLFELARQGLRVLGWLGTAAKWIGTVAAAVAAIYGAFYAVTHGGELPK